MWNYEETYSLWRGEEDQRESAKSGARAELGGANRERNVAKTRCKALSGHAKRHGDVRRLGVRVRRQAIARWIARWSVQWAWFWPPEGRAVYRSIAASSHTIGPFRCVATGSATASRPPLAPFGGYC
ncbi:hypothetical protein AAFF_G00282060 [Aldrovandia affinis]|uniref:Uncharacterized protein n=1 Tax=Aldrovandia affinis TaxID=143900 RepID=A0AAD7W273_9TELE|nr:hypothetical protein AAFF_G00282060 [Aldrovandia affinis]